MPDTEGARVGSGQQIIKLTLLENSHAFLREAVEKAIHANHDVRGWQFALLNLVQALELSLKAALKAIHPVLIFADIDNPNNITDMGNPRRTVGPREALSRLRNPLIGGRAFSPQDEVRIERAIKMRNQMTHADFDLTPQHAAANFFELFAFVAEFQRHELKIRVSDVLTPGSFDALLKIKRLLQELVRRAEERIRTEGIREDDVWSCPDCAGQTLVIAGDVGTCYACSYTAPVTRCPYCSDWCFEHELVSFLDDLETDYNEGQTVVVEDYGYRDCRACENCIGDIRADIRRQREDQRDELYRLEEEFKRSGWIDAKDR